MTVSKGQNYRNGDKVSDFQRTGKVMGVGTTVKGQQEEVYLQQWSHSVSQL